MATLSGTPLSMFSDEQRIFSAGSGFLFLPGFSFVPFCSCVLISVLFSFILKSKLLLLKRTFPFAFKGGKEYTEFAQAPCYLTWALSAVIKRIYGFSAEAGLYLTVWNELQMLKVETDSLHPCGNHHEHKLYRAITISFFGACGLYLGYIKAPLLALKITI